MTPNVECAQADTTLLDALNIMERGHFRHLPVTARSRDSDELTTIGIVDVLSLVHEAYSVMDRACSAEPLMQVGRYCTVPLVAKLVCLVDSADQAVHYSALSMHANQQPCSA
jgi:CBS domain-containing protein